MNKKIASRGRSGSIPVRGKDFFLLFAILSEPALEPIKLPIKWVPEALSLGVKGTKHEADHSSPSSSGFKNVSSWRIT
jgi:hypothetical protein